MFAYFRVNKHVCQVHVFSLQGIQYIIMEYTTTKAKDLNLDTCTNIHPPTPAHVPICIALEPLYEAFGQAFVAELLIASRCKALKLFALQLPCNFVRMALFPGFPGPWYKSSLEFATFSISKSIPIYTVIMVLN
jgi:hypothetical protein